MPKGIPQAVAGRKYARAFKAEPGRVLCLGCNPAHYFNSPNRKGIRFCHLARRRQDQAPASGRVVSVHFGNGTRGREI